MYVTVHRGTQRIGGNPIEIGTDETRLLDFCEERHITVVNLHASGHASRKTLQALIDGLRPAVLLPIHMRGGGQSRVFESARQLPDAE